MNEPSLQYASTAPRRPVRWGPTLFLAAVLTIYFFATRPVAAPPGWGDDFNAAVQQAAASGKNVLVAFYSQGCPPCAAMDRSVLPTETVREELADFVPVRVDVTRDRELALQFGVFSTPTYVVLGPHGKLIARSDGYQSPDMFVSFLRRARAARS